MATETKRLDSIADLPFVGPRPPERPGKFPRCFWSVQSTGDHQRDDILGYELALAYLRHDVAQDHNVAPYILPWIVGDMPAELTPIEVSFLTVVAIAASTGLPAAERTVAYWESCRAERAAEEGAKKERRASRRKGGAA